MSFRDLVKVHRRLVQEVERARAKEHPSQGDALPFARRDRPATVSQPRRPTLRQTAHELRPARLCQGPGEVVVARLSVGQAKVVSQAGRQERGPFGQIGDEAAPRSGSMSRISSPPAVTWPAPGEARARSSEITVDLPAPLGPTRTTVSPGEMVRLDLSQQRDLPAGQLRVTERSSTGPGTVRLRPGPPGRRRADQRQRPGGGSEALGALVELGARPAQREVHLGRHDEHGQRRQVQAPVNRRKPSGTATRATDTDPSVSSTRAERKATRSTLELDGRAPRWHGRCLLAAVPCAQRRGEPVTPRSGRQPGARDVRRGATARQQAARPADESAEYREESHDYCHDDGRNPVQGPHGHKQGEGAAAASTRSGRQRPT